MTTSASTPYTPSAQPGCYERFGFGWGAELAGLGIAIGFDLFFAEMPSSRRDDSGPAHPLG